MIRYFKNCIDYAPGAFFAGLMISMLCFLFGLMTLVGLEASATPLCDQPVNVLYFNQEKYVRQP